MLGAKLTLAVRTGALGVALVLLPCLAGAQTAPNSPATAEDVRKQLESDRGRLEATQRRSKEIQADMDKLAAERERINSRLVETGKLIQQSEAQLGLIESRLGDLEAQEKQVRGSLEERHGSISALLAAMQRMGRNPPPVMVTQREDALSMVRSAMLLAAAFPELRGEAVALSERLNALIGIMTSIRSEGEKLKAETTRLNDARLRLAGLQETKRQSLAERQSELAQVRQAAADITKSVSDLGDLIQKLKDQLKLTSIVVTHDMRLAKKLADRVVFLYEAKAIFFGTYADMEKSPQPIIQEFLELDELKLEA